MEGIIQLTDAQRQTVVSHIRYGSTGRVSRHAHILLLLDRGWSYREIMDGLGSDCRYQTQVCQRRPRVCTGDEDGGPGRARMVRDDLYLGGWLDAAGLRILSDSLVVRDPIRAVARTEV